MSRWPHPGPDGQPTTPPPDVLSRADRDRIRACSEAVNTPAMFGRSCGCARQCRQLERSVTWLECEACERWGSV